jgi:hypothetical protein
VQITPNVVSDAALRYMRESARAHRVDHRTPGNEFDTFTAQRAAHQLVRSLISTPR